MPQCMDKYKNDFAIEFAKLMQKNSQKWKKVQHDARLELLSPSSFGYYLLWFWVVLSLEQKSVSII